MKNDINPIYCLLFVYEICFCHKPASHWSISREKSQHSACLRPAAFSVKALARIANCCRSTCGSIPRWRTWSIATENFRTVRGTARLTPQFEVCGETTVAATLCADDSHACGPQRLLLPADFLVQSAAPPLPMRAAREYASNIREEEQLNKKGIAYSRLLQVDEINR